MDRESLKIFLINFDWRDIFRDSFSLLKEKLDRDRLEPDRNDFFIFSWSRVSYIDYSTKNNFKTIHLKTRLDFFRPLLDIKTLVCLPFIVRKSKFRPDIWLSYDFNSIPALFLCKLIFGGKIFMCINNQPRIYSATRRFGNIKSAYSFILEKTMSIFIDKYFTINSTMKNYLLDLGVQEDKIGIFSMNTIIRDDMYIKESKKGLIRSKLGIKENGKIILTVARLEYEKNYFELIKLFSGLDDNYHLIILGQGRLLEQLKKHCLDLGVEDRVFFEGFVGRDNIWNYYRDADIFVLLSKAEALGMVFWEAMYMGIPVVGSRVDGIVESIGENQERGMLWNIQGENEKSFKEIIDFCVTESEGRKKMIVEAKSYVEEKIKNLLTIDDLYNGNK